MLTLNTLSLRAALTLAKGAIMARNTIPILSNIRVTSDASGVRITATDMEVAYLLPVGGAGGGWDLTVPHKQLAGLVAAYKGATVTMEPAEGDRVRVCVGGMSSHLPTLPVEDYPTLAGVDTFPNKMTLPAPVLRNAFAVPQHAMLTEETRYDLNGVFMRMLPEKGGVKGAAMVTVATDGRRMVKVETVRPDGVDDGAPGIIVPRVAVACLLAFLGKSANAVTVEWSDSRLRVTRPDGGVLVSKTIDRSFPEYERVIPREFPYVVTAPAAELAETIKRVSSVGSSFHKPVKLTFGGNVVDVSASDDATGTASERIDGGLVTTPAEPMEIGFQARYLRDVLAWCGETVEIALSDAGRGAVLMRPVGDPTRTFVLMPMRV